MADAHSLVRFADLRFHGVSTHLYRNGAQIINGLLDGTRLVFAKMPPTLEVDVR